MQSKKEYIYRKYKVKKSTFIANAKFKKSIYKQKAGLNNQKWGGLEMES